MRAGQPSRRTATYLKRFDVLFGAIFLGVAVADMVIFSVVYLLLRGDLGEMSSLFLAIPLVVTAIFGGIGAVFLTRGIRRVRRDERLRQHGTTTEATIVAVERTNTRVNRRYLWRIRYVYDEYGGLPVEGDSGYLAADEAKSYRVGEHVFVRYDPARPSESVWLGREDVPA